ncbi:hypothetical protein C2G38_2051898 [Gigaspora rosea]|uniref:Uncharacterized protein n=1 Tax=Gigaspora rosea TaxID=44941 RepID=A0A397TUP5_9GLOM|nr:hypothetical protein C2G38_2051898 [Gigaspora rosea]
MRQLSLRDRSQRQYWDARQFLGNFLRLNPFFLVDLTLLHWAQDNIFGNFLRLRLGSTLWSQFKMFWWRCRVYFGMCQLSLRDGSRGSVGTQDNISGNFLRLRLRSTLWVPTSNKEFLKGIDERN